MERALKWIAGGFLFPIVPGWWLQEHGSQYAWLLPFAMVGLAVSTVGWCAIRGWRLWGSVFLNAIAENKKLRGENQELRDRLAKTEGLEEILARAKKQWALDTRSAVMNKVGETLPRELQREWFMLAGQNIPDPDYRVALWVPVWEHDQIVKWRCAGRTGKERCGFEWPHRIGINEIEEAGVLCRTFKDNVQADVEGLVDAENASQALKNEYYERASLSEGLALARSWRYASLRTMKMPHGGKILAIIVVERKSGLPIDGNAAEQEEVVDMFAKMLGHILEAL